MKELLNYENLNVDLSIAISETFRLGSWRSEVLFDNHYYFKTLQEEVFWKKLPRVKPSLEKGLDARIVFYDQKVFHPASISPDPLPADTLTVIRQDTAMSVRTEVLVAHLFLNEHPPTILINIEKSNIPHHEFRIHLSVVFHKLLLWLNRTMLHAAGIKFQDSVSLFVGDNCAGKSSISLKLSRAGGVILSDDRMLVKKDDNGFLASGCDETIRLTEKSENYFFAEPVSFGHRDPHDLKKEFYVSSVAETSPFQDFPLDRLFFSHVGHKFQIQPMPKQEALLHLIRKTKSYHRFADPEDYDSYLTFLSSLTERLPVYRLELSPNLADLDQLVAFLQAQ